MDKYLYHIDKQIEFNQGKNIFLEDKIALRFIDETIKAISSLNELNQDCEDLLINYATEKAIEEFCRINQYYAFSSQAKEALRNIYKELFTNIRTRPNTFRTIEKKHYQNIKQWLKMTNPSAEKIYSKAETDIQPVACSEYRPELQIDILRIDATNITEPVLDIGCGKLGNLVNYFCDRGIVAYGIDRFSFAQDNLMTADWLEYNYGLEKWGTIVSNLGFSNHFKHHNLREDGNYIEYAKKYMDILKSLKIGGSFFYAPDLPFIESFLNKQQYKVDRYEIGNSDFKTTVIKRLM